MIDDSSLIKDSQGRIFFIDNGQKRLIKSQRIFDELDFDKKDIKIVNDQMINKIPSGRDINFIYDAIVYNQNDIISDGSLIMGTSKKVYLMEKGKKRHILSPKVFNQLQRSKKEIMTIDDFILEQIPVGPQIVNKEATDEQIIVMIYSGSFCNANRFYAFDLADAFHQLGYELKTVDLTKPNAAGKLNSILKQNNIFFILGLNGNGIELLHQLIYKNKLKVPYLALLVDHPMYHSDRPFKFDHAANNLIVSVIDKLHIEALEKYSNGKYSKTFIPHGGSINSKIHFQQKPMNARNIDILFIGSFTDPELNRKEWLTNFKYKSLMDEIVESALYMYEEPLLDIAKRVFDRNQKSFNYSDKELRYLLSQVDLYIRFRRRQEVLKKLSGLAMHVYGVGKEIDGKAIYHPPINFFKTPRLLGDAKFVLNVISNWVYAGHERIFTSMLARSVVLSDKNRFLKKHFKHKENIYFFDIKNPNLAEEIDQQLSDINKLQYMADNGRLITQKHHTCMNRALEIIDAVNQHNILKLAD